MKYTTVKYAESKAVISRSKFLSFAYHVESEEQTMDILRTLRKTYYDATHVCYASVWDVYGNASRYSDDGEPGGTAGAPILDVIKASGLRQIMIVVVRYFGGVKLGTGGLTRAYSGGAADVIEAAEKEEYLLCDIYRAETDFNSFRKLGFLNTFDIEYTDKVCFKIAIPEGGDMTPAIDKTGGKIVLDKICTDFIKFS